MRSPAVDLHAAALGQGERRSGVHGRVGDSRWGQGIRMHGQEPRVHGPNRRGELFRRGAEGQRGAEPERARR